MKLNKIQTELEKHDLFVRNCFICLKQQKRDLKAENLRQEILNNEVARHSFQNQAIFQARHQFLSPTSRRIQAERAMLAKMIRGDQDEANDTNEMKVSKAEEKLYHKEHLQFDELLREVANEFCGNDVKEREKFLMGIFEISGMAAMTDLNEAYDKVP